MPNTTDEIVSVLEVSDKMIERRLGALKIAAENDADMAAAVLAMFMAMINEYEDRWRDQIQTVKAPH